MNEITAIRGCIGKVCVKTEENAVPQDVESYRRSHHNKHFRHAIRNNGILVALAGVLLILTVLQVVSTKAKPYYLNVSHSVPFGIYRIIPPKKIGIGDLVVFDPPQGVRSYVYGRSWLPVGWPLIKYVGATEGDTYAVLDGLFTINSNYVGPVYERDSDGKALPYNGGRFVVERNTFLPVSTLINNSFDGRYFGTVPLSAVKGKLKPIWIF